MLFKYDIFLGNLNKILMVILTCSPLLSFEVAGGTDDYKTTNKSLLMIDKVWAGTRVEFDAIENESFIYIAYYDDDKWLSVAQINKQSNTVNKIKLPSQFNGWDAHNHITLSFDEMGILHIAGNMHSSKLVYARMTQHDELDSLAQLQPMIGQLEDHVTYPKFFKFNDGKLGFMYRHGGSGNGVEIINRYDNGKWQRWLGQPLFASSAESRSVNAYHTGFIKGPDGVFHIAWVWRSNPNVESNFNVNYAKSHDLKNWLNVTGDNLTLPITPESNVMVDLIAPESGLFNNIKLGFDANNQPVISYLKFDENGYSQLHHARPQNDEWQITESTNWTYRWDPRGWGTIPAEISFSGIQQNQNRTLEYVQHSQFGNLEIEYETNNLQQMNAKLSSIKVLDKQALMLNRRIVRNSQNKSEIQWYSMPANNRDRPRNCEQLDCSLEAELVLNINN